MLPTGNLDHSFMDHAFVSRVHALVDLVDDAEGGLSHGLEGHEVEDCRNGTFAAGLAMGVELLQGLVFAMRMLVSLT